MSGPRAGTDPGPGLSRGMRELVAAGEDTRPANLVFVCVVAAEVVGRLALVGPVDVATLSPLPPLLGAVLLAHLAVVRNHRTAFGLGATLLNVLAVGLAAAAFGDFWVVVSVLLPAMFVGRLVGMGAAAVVLLVATSLFVLPVALWGSGGLEERHQTLAVAIVLVGLVSAGAVRAWNEDLASLERQRSVLDTVVENVTVGLLLVDERGEELLSNPRQREFTALGYPGAATDDPRSGATSEVFVEDGETPLPVQMQPVARATRGEDFSAQVLWIGPDPSTRRAISGSGHAITDHRGRRVGSLLVCTDLTEVLEAVRVKQDFVALVSHELRTPLTSILGYLDLALEDADQLPADVTGHLQTAERNSQRLLRLVGDLLSTASAEQGTLEMTPLPSPLHEVVRESLMELRGFAERHRVTVRSQVPALPLVDIDVFRTSQVVANLVSNAVKYSPAGGEVEVRLRAEGRWAVLEVEDRGIGMTGEEAELAFSKFYRTKHVSDQAIQGVGLGLPITQTIVHGMGGTIELSSRPGQGTTATVRLLLSAEPEVAPGPVGGTSSWPVRRAPAGAASAPVGESTD